MFGQAVIEELIPWIDEHYRTLPERRYRAIGGLSRGAGWAVHLGLSRWDLFGAIGAHSLAIFGADVPYNVNRWLDSIPPDAYPRIYLDIADRDRQDVTATTEHFEALLTEKEIPHEWHLFNGYHDEAYWGAHVEDYLRWYTESWGEDRP
jgi:enterochelin esterase-like enzyme